MNVRQHIVYLVSGTCSCREERGVLAALYLAHGHSTRGRSIYEKERVPLTKGNGHETAILPARGREGRCSS